MPPSRAGTNYLSIPQSYLMKLLLLLLIAVIILVYVLMRKNRPKTAVSPIADKDLHVLMQAHIAFYKALDETAQQHFRERVAHFLGTVRILPVGTVQVTDLDKVYTAASAIIPIFAFPGWAYNNLDEVLIYPSQFSADFDQESDDRNVLGMVGDGAMHRLMIISQPSLRAGFEQQGAGNTGIHEFAHLLDKADGATDGLPEYLIPKELVQPWLQQMHQAIVQIKQQHSDINPYATTNEAEFFAVLSEYFFQKPKLLQQHHPELFCLLEQIYMRK
jgi:Mlc titration factor MtfA (ptsG expression regulator)